ncbi:RNA polymerase sigma-I factor [Virgibacillus sp. W0430]|uniref:RNA polymerase sigma-I factor n=1 Tax=Virgibacillus sp. W0430 TaxID=3391580 RepID=UPI003F482F9A
MVTILCNMQEKHENKHTNRKVIVSHLDETYDVSDCSTMSMEEALYFVQRGNEQLQNYLLLKYEPFIAKCVSEVCKRYIDPKKDDEYSVGLFGFYEAMLKYCPAKGASFFSFANVVIKRKVIDYIRYVRKTPYMYSINDIHGEENCIQHSEWLAAKEKFENDNDLWSLQEEIKQFQESLACYRIGIKELEEISPKHQDARLSAVRVANILYKEAHLNHYVRSKKKLPIKSLLGKVTVSKKTLERQRKFIIAVFIVLCGDYLYLKDYIKDIAGM